MQSDAKMKLVLDNLPRFSTQANALVKLVDTVKMTTGDRFSSLTFPVAVMAAFASGSVAVAPEPIDLTHAAASARSFAAVSLARDDQAGWLLATACANMLLGVSYLFEADVEVADLLANRAREHVTQAMRKLVEALPEDDATPPKPTAERKLDSTLN